MKTIAIIGGGIAGCAAAVELAEADNRVIIIEKSANIGGNIQNFGCKAVDICTRCNLCLVDDIINDTLDNKSIEIMYETRVHDLEGDTGHYSLIVERNGEFDSLQGIDDIILATGYKKWSDLETGTPEIFSDDRIIWSSNLEEFLQNRRDHGQENALDLDFTPESVTFIQCNGSRSIQEKASYCSRICCGYNYRMARVLRYFFPEIEINMFFMDIQDGGMIQDISFSDLDEVGINYINCKPVKINKHEDSLQIIYEKQTTGKMDNLSTELLVLSEGIHPNQDNEKWAQIFNLQLDEYGFLYPIESELKTGIFLAGTIKGPGDIAATISDGKNTAYKIINNEDNNFTEIPTMSGGCIDV